VGIAARQDGWWNWASPWPKDQFSAGDSRESARTVLGEGHEPVAVVDLDGLADRLVDLVERRLLERGAPARTDRNSSDWHCRPLF
jgi:hypothetical protein